MFSALLQEEESISQAGEWAYIQLDQWDSQRPSQVNPVPGAHEAHQRQVEKSAELCMLSWFDTLYT